MQIQLLSSQQLDRGDLQGRLMQLEREARELRAKNLESTKHLAKQQDQALDERVNCHCSLFFFNIIVQSRQSEAMQALRTQLRDAKSELAEARYLLQDKGNELERVTSENKTALVKSTNMQQERDLERVRREQAERQLKELTGEHTRAKGKNLEVEVEITSLKV